jgi:hypothetical protein
MHLNLEVFWARIQVLRTILTSTELIVDYVP